jgi:hypothetical protein
LFFFQVDAELECISKAKRNLGAFYFSCNGECTKYDYNGNNTNWLCNGYCQNISEPCNKKCVSEWIPINCNGKCELQDKMTVHECMGKCLDYRTPCNGVCPRNCADCNSETFDCNGFCQNVKIPCESHCPNERYLDCNGQCTKSPSFHCQHQNLTWLCNNKCQNWTESCNGKCPVPCLYLNCNDECVENPDETYICNGKCISVSEPCNNSCRSDYELNCNGECENQPITVFKCGTRCQSLDIPCFKNCSNGLNYDCNENRCVRDIDYWICNDICQPVWKPCNSKCLGARRLTCDGKCDPDDLPSRVHLCNDNCIDITAPCNGTCNQQNGILCNGVCSNMADIKQWLCNGKCIPWEEPCDGKCLSDVHGFLNYSYAGKPYPSYESVLKETYWKCPNDNKCISSFKFCSSYNHPNPYYGLGLRCPHRVEVSREVCENPNKYNISLNCEERGLFSCKGHRAQCIRRENVCDGFLQCMDRSDESHCTEVIIELDYNIFKPCRTDKNELGFKCDDKICLPIENWCRNKFYKVSNVHHLNLVCPALISSMNSEILCKNKTFWQHKPCAKRCSGNYPGECGASDKRAQILLDPCPAINQYEHAFCADKSNLVCNRYKYVNREACSQTYMKMCTDNLTCIHEDLFCDGNTHCPDGSDEIEDICKKCPRTFGFPPDKLKFATFSCKHRYTGKYICSVPCDGKDDLCLDNADEICQEDTVTITIIAIGFLILLTVISGEIIIVKQENNKKCNDPIKTTDFKCLIDLLYSSINYKQKLKFKSIHDAEGYNTTISLLMTFLSIQKKSVSKNLAKQFIYFENCYHKGNDQSLHLCLNENFRTNGKANFFFSMTKSAGFVDWLYHKMKKNNLNWKFSTSAKQITDIMKITFLAMIKITFYYLDLVKDLVIIFLYIRYFPVAQTNFSSFAVQVLILLCISISLPGVVNHILIFFDYQSSKITSKTTRGILQILAPLAPAISVYIQARLSHRKSQLLNIFSNQKQMENDDSFLDLHKAQCKLDCEVQAWMKLHSKLRLNENSTEHFIQAIFLIILILLKFSETSTVTGFQDLFASKEVLLLALSALWSNMSIVFGTVNASIVKKNQFMPKLGKLLITLFSLVSHFGRVAAVILFFSPSMGLMNLLMHWKMGNKLVKENLQALIYDVEKTNVLIGFERMWKPVQDVSELTILSLETQCKIFLGLVVFHYLAMFIIKFVYSNGFSIHQSKTEKMFHIIIQVWISKQNILLVSKDFSNPSC